MRKRTERPFRPRIVRPDGGLTLRDAAIAMLKFTDGTMDREIQSVRKRLQAFVENGR